MTDVVTHEYRQDPEHPNGWCTCGLPKANQRHAANLAWIGAETLANDPLAAHIDERIRLVAGLGEPFSANDVRQFLSDSFPADRKKALVGARFLALRNRGEITDVGTTVASTDPGTHGHRIAVYRAGPALHQSGAAA